MKSHFQFTRKQRSGIFLLLILIFAVQLIYFLIDFSSNDVLIEDEDLSIFQAELDSLKLLKKESSKPKIYPFNPNFITDYKGYTLGMSNSEIDRLHDFRSKDQWINSKSEFQKVTKISDSLLAEISPYFKFPDWVTNPKPRNRFNADNKNEPKTFQQKIDLNTATTEQLRKVNGIGEKLSERIVNYRERMGSSFVADVQLQEIYGLSPEVIERVLNEFTVKTAKPIIKLNLNSATTEELVTIRHIDYEIAHNIIETRTLLEGFNDLDELLKVKDFPVNRIEIIKLYLTLE